MEPQIYRDYVNILKEELVPAMGCTEPIAIAYAAVSYTHLCVKLIMHERMKVTGLWMPGKAVKGCPP